IFVLVWCLVLGGLFSAAAFAGEQVRVYPLHYRLAEEILPQIKSLLKGEERASFADTNLVIVASPKTLEAVGQLIQLLDRPLKQFLVQVKWVDRPAASAGRFGFDGSSGQTTLPAAGLSLGTSQRQSGQRLRMTEGQPAKIVTGKDVPYTARWAAWTGEYSQGVAEETSFQQIRSGFTLRIRVRADEMLQVELVPQLMSVGVGSMLRPGVVALDRLATRILVHAGEWVDVAAFLPDSSIGASILAGSEEALPAGRRLMLRIDAQK
ncbi:MAG: hypothetical protein L3J63_12100, partial [Geopsychrobacter sp.]|nr:hypothetical protein [Geopsychrobacter sp.]